MRSRTFLVSSSLLGLTLVFAPVVIASEPPSPPARPQPAAGQTSCVLAITPDGTVNADFLVSDIEMTIDVSDPSCAWTISFPTNPDGMASVGSTSGTGDAVVTVSLAANQGGAFPNLLYQPARSASVQVTLDGNGASDSFTIFQESTCLFEVSPFQHFSPKEGDSFQITVEGPPSESFIRNSASCTWTATAPRPFLSLPGTTTGGGNDPVLVDVDVAANEASRAQQRSGEVLITDDSDPANTTSVTVVQFPSQCAVMLTPDDATVVANGGSRTYGVTAPEGCDWTVVDDASWLSVSPGSGNGPGSVTATADPNGDGIARVATLTATETVTSTSDTATLTQGATVCSLDVSPTQHDIDAAGESVSSTITAPAGCGWSVAFGDSEEAAFVSGGESGAGNGTTSLTMSANPSSASRQSIATVSLDGGSITETIQLDQAGVACTIALDVADVDIGGATTRVDVNVLAPAGCSWTATATTDPGGMLGFPFGGTGSGTLPLSIDASANGTGSQRTGIVTVEIDGGGPSADLQIDQASAACAITLDPTSSLVAAGGGTADTAVDVGAVGAGAEDAFCSWTAVATAGATDAVSFGGGNSFSDTGDGPLAVSIDPNPGALPRSFEVTVTIDGTATSTTFEIEQSAAVCTIAASPSTRAVGTTGGPTSFDVLAPAGCPWTAAITTNPSGMLSFSGLSSSSGNATVPLSVTASGGGARTGVVTATLDGGSASATFSVTQGSCTLSVSPDTVDLGFAGGQTTATITTEAECSWSATVSNDPSAAGPTFVGASTGTGSGSVTIDVPANAVALPRTMTISVAVDERTSDGLVIDQDAAPCSLAFVPTSFTGVDNGGETLTFDVDTNGPDCSWTLASGGAFLPSPSQTAGTGDMSDITVEVPANPDSVDRTDTVEASGDDASSATLSVQQNRTACTLSLDPTSFPAVSADGETLSFDLDTLPSCSWNLAAGAIFENLSQSSGTGSVTGITVDVPANPDAVQRDDTIDATGDDASTATLAVTQTSAACTLALDPAAVTDVSADGATLAFAIDTLASCSWSLAAGSMFGDPSVDSGTGPLADILISVQPNPGVKARTDTLVASGDDDSSATATVKQDGAECAVTLTPSSAGFGRFSGGSSFAVNAPIGCKWTASADSSWVTVTAGASGSGDGTVSFSVGRNNDPAARVATILVKDQLFTISQSGASGEFGLSPIAAGFGAAGGSGAFDVDTDGALAWVATSDAEWLRLVTSSGSGDGTVLYEVEANTADTSRVGTIAVAGEVFTVRQAPAGESSIDVIIAALPGGGSRAPARHSAPGRE